MDFGSERFEISRNNNDNQPSQKQRARKRPGAKGKPKCELCRERKKKCLYSNPQDTCERCAKYRRECTGKELASATNVLRDAAAKRKEDIARIVRDAEKLLDGNLDVEILVGRMHGRCDCVPREEELSSIASTETPPDRQQAATSTYTEPIDFDMMALLGSTSAASFPQPTPINHDTLRSNCQYPGQSPHGPSISAAQMQEWLNFTGSAAYTYSDKANQEFSWFASELTASNPFFPNGDWETKSRHPLDDLHNTNAQSSTDYNNIEPYTYPDTTDIEQLADDMPWPGARQQ